jgi:hypothetical protein
MHQQRQPYVRALFGALFLALLPMSGCAGEFERRWTEEVELDDGKVIEVSRYVKFTESNSISGDAYSSTGLESTLNFKGEFSELPTWSVPLVPILLYRDMTKSEWVIVATTSNCDTWYDHGSPVPPYWEYRLKNGKWSESKLSMSSIGRATNLFFDFEPSLPARRMSVDIKNRWLSAHDFAKDYLKIEADIKVNCMQR